MKTTLLLALSDRRVQRALSAVLQETKEPDLTVYTLSDPFCFVDKIKELRPDIVIVSCNICSPPLVETVRTTAGIPACRFVHYCDTTSDEILSERSDGHMSSDDSDREVIDLIASLVSAEEKEEEAQELTPREREVIIGVVKGMTNKEIADELFISPNTVTTHRRNIVKKLDIHSASGLTVYAIMNKLVSLQDIEI